MKKHIICFGDSNTHGFCADPEDCADGGDRFNEEERYPCLLQKALGDRYLVIEEGLSGRTSVFEDPLSEGLSGVSVITPILKTHEPVDLLIIMLGTNDTKERFSCNAGCIAEAMGRLFKKARDTECWGKGGPKILYVCPPPILPVMETGIFAEHMGKGCVEKSRELASKMQSLCAQMNVEFLDAAGCEFNSIDGMHLTARGHRQLASLLAGKISGGDVSSR